MNAQACGAEFNLADFLKARACAIEAVGETAQQILPGMNENQCHDILKKELTLKGVEKFWHPTKLRINSNTIKNFRDLSEEIRLTEDDLFFIDIGPVFYNHEADYGETFVIGSNPRLINLQRATKEIFYAAQTQWKEHNLTGHELYEFASCEAKKHNLKLNSNMYGHRLGDFPHALHYNGKLGDFKFTPIPHLWVLEIHLIDETINRGAFFEDILI